MKDWKIAARKRFPDQTDLIEQSNKPADFFASLAAALPADTPPDVALRHTRGLDRLLLDILVIDPRFFMRRGVGKAVRDLRERLTDLAYVKPPPAQVARAVAFADEFAQSFLADDKRTREALSWLKGSGGKHTLGELASTAVSVRLVNTIYRAGATTVWAVKINMSPDGMENTGKLVIELPREAAARRQVLEWARRRSKGQGFDEEVTDEGQHYVFVMLD